jgi:hypothetical protein
MGMTRDDRPGRAHELLTLNAGTVFVPTVATYTIDTNITPSAALIGPIETQAVRYTFHGVDPVVATKLGHLIAAGDSITISGKDNVKNLRFVREAAVTAYIPITYLY